jgi:hypothetical protein
MVVVLRAVHRYFVRVFSRVRTRYPMGRDYKVANKKVLCFRARKRVISACIGASKGPASTNSHELHSGRLPRFHVQSRGGDILTPAPKVPFGTSTTVFHLIFMHVLP